VAPGTVTEAQAASLLASIQTMCTHCNSANIQVGGLSKEYAPITRNDYPVIGGLATSLVMSILPSDTIGDARCSRGRGPRGSRGRSRAARPG